MLVNYYDLLEISRTATAEEIRTAITKQRRIWVRRQSSPDPDRRAEAEQRVRQIDQAEKTLLNPTQRSSYDAELAGQRSPLPPPRNLDQSPRDLRTAREWIERARAHMADGNPRAAERAARQAAGMEHGNAEAWYLVGEAGLAQDDLRVAEDAFEDAVHHEPGNADYRCALAEVYLEDEAWEQAAGEFGRALRNAPDHPRAQSGLGVAYARMGRSKEGLALLNKAIEAAPEDQAIKVMVAKGHYHLAMDAVPITAAVLIEENRRGRPRQGSPTIVSRRQLALVRRSARKIRALRLSDPEVAEMERELRDLARESVRATWKPSFFKRYYAIVLGIAIVLMAFAPRGVDTSPFQIFGAVVAVLTVGLYVWRHRIPNWKRWRRELTYTFPKKGK